MPIYRVKETRLAYVTFLYDVIADNEDDASWALDDSDTTVIDRGCSVGDTCDTIDIDTKREVTLISKE